MPRATVLRPAYLCGVFLLAFLTVVGRPTPALAHATLQQTTPVDRQVIDTGPRRLTLEFSEPVSLRLARIQLIAPDGDAVATGRPTHPGGKSETVEVRVPGILTKGSYTVAWQTVSADSHPVRGTFTFSVGEPMSGGTPAPGPAAESGGWSVVVHDITRWSSFAGLALLVGTAFFVAACWPAGVRSRRARKLLWTGWSVLLASTVLAFAGYGPYVVNGPLSSAADPGLLAVTLNTRMGAMLVVRTVLLLLTAVAAALYLRHVAARGTGTDDRAGGTPRATVVLAVGCALALTWSLATHSVAGPLVGPAVLTDTVHLVAMAVWIGGLTLLGALLVRSPDLSGLEPALRRFSRTAQVCVGLLVVTGVFQAWRNVTKVSALYDTDYGRVLLGKAGLVAVLLVLGAAARAWVRRHCGARPATVPNTRRQDMRLPDGRRGHRLIRLVVAETLIAAVLLGFSAVLVRTDPAEAEQSRPAGQPGQARQQAPVGASPPTGTAPTAGAAVPSTRTARFDSGGRQGKGVVAVVVDPATTGANQVHLSVLDLRGRPMDVPEVRAEFTLAKPSLGPVEAPLTYLGAGHHISSTVFLPMRGRWSLTVTVRTSDIDQAVVRIPVDVQ